MKTNAKVGLAAAGLAAVGLAGFGIVAASNATAEAPVAPVATTSSSGAPSTGAGPGQEDKGGPRGGQHTPVTGDEAKKVSDAVTGKFPGVSVTSVEKDEDGSYDVNATKDGASVRYKVSADLATIEERTGGHGPGGKGPGQSDDTPVTGDEAQKVIDAVKAKDSAATITEVRKDPDGSYDAVGTKDGQRVMYDVSADLKTITEAGKR